MGGNPTPSPSVLWEKQIFQTRLLYEKEGDVLPKIRHRPKKITKTTPAKNATISDFKNSNSRQKRHIFNVITLKTGANNLNFLAISPNFERTYIYSILIINLKGKLTEIF